MGLQRVGHDWATFTFTMLNTPCICCLPLQHPSLVVTYQKEGHRATELPYSTAALLMPIYDCLWNNARGRNQDPNTFVPHPWFLTVNRHLIKVPRLLWRVPWRPRFNPWVRKSPWRRKWHPSPVLLPGKSHGKGRGTSPWGMNLQVFPFPQAEG